MILWLTTAALAGGGPPNVMVIYNAEVLEASEVAAHYSEVRSLPVGHICGLVGIDPEIRQMPLADYQSLILAPVHDCIGALPQPDEIDYLVVVRGLPYLVDVPNYVASLSAALGISYASTDTEPLMERGQIVDDPMAATVSNPYYISGTCSDLDIDNRYAGSYTGACGLAAEESLPVSFSRASAGEWSGYDFTDNLFVVTRLDGFDYGDAMDLIDRGVASDGTFPGTDILCMQGGDDARAARDPECEFATRMLAADGANAVWLDPFDPDLSGHSLSAFFTGATNIQNAFDGNTWSPGAIACNLTSFGAAPNNFFCNDDGTVCPESESQTSIARMVRAGATGAHGTAAEPLNNVFPNAGVLMLYTSGYNLGESFFFSQRYLFWQNIVLGDPLATPYGERPVVTVPAEASDNLEITATHSDGVADITLYIAGERVADSDSDILLHELDLEPGDTIEVLAVARSVNYTVQRTGWPVTEQKVRSRVQGWTHTMVTIVPVDEGDTDGQTVGLSDESGCGCQNSGPGGGLALPLLALAMIRRRAQTARESGRGAGLRSS